MILFGVSERELLAIFNFVGFLSCSNHIYVDDLKVFAAPEGKLDRVLKMAKTVMENVGLQWNPKKVQCLARTARSSV